MKIFLVREDEPERVEKITADNQVGRDESPYYNKSWASHYILNQNCSYIAIISTYNVDDPMSGVFTIKSNVPIDYENIQPLT